MANTAEDTAEEETELKKHTCNHYLKEVVKLGGLWTSEAHIHREIGNMKSTRTEESTLSSHFSIRSSIAKDHPNRGLRCV